MGQYNLPPDIATYIGGLNQRLSNLERHAPVGRWVGMEAISTKIDLMGVYVRSENFGNTARIKGALHAKEAIPVGTDLFTVPQGLRVAEFARLVGQYPSTPTLGSLTLFTSGIVENHMLELPVGAFLGFDGITYNLT
jgi:hypothetical protein